MSEPLPFSELNRLYSTQMSGWVTRAQIETSLLQSGSGTRAVIYGMDEVGATGHVWNAVVQHGRINYIDGQIGQGGAVNFSYFPSLRFGIIYQGSAK
jgi:filamentous hemagglutinin